MGDDTAMKLRNQIARVDTRIDVQRTHLEKTAADLAEFEKKAAVEIGELNEELAAAEKAKNTAGLCATAAQRNLDSFTCALKSIVENMAGDINPRKRFVPAMPKATSERAQVWRCGGPRASRTRPGL